MKRTMSFISVTEYVSGVSWLEKRMRTYVAQVLARESARLAEVIHGGVILSQLARDPNPTIPRSISLWYRS
jgi:hypothetical protein